MHQVFVRLHGNSSVVNIHGFLISCCSTFSPWASAPSALFEGIQPVSKWNITEVPPPHLRQIIFYIPPTPHPHIHVLVWNIKIGESDSAGTSFLWDSHQCEFTPPPITFSPSLWWTPRWSWSSRLHPSPPPAGPLWYVCRHLLFIHIREFN